MRQHGLALFVCPHNAAPDPNSPSGHFATPEPPRTPSTPLATYGQTMSDKAAYILAYTAIRHPITRPPVLIKIIHGH